MELIGRYVRYIRDVRRYSDRTVDIYESVLEHYARFVSEDGGDISDEELVAALNHSEIRQYMAELMDADPPFSPKTISLHMTALSSFCRFLMKFRYLKSNPVRLVPKPKQEKRLPHFFKKDAMQEYFDRTAPVLQEVEFFIGSWHTDSGKKYYRDFLGRIIISILYSLGIRRAELIGLNVADVDFGRNVVKVRGKGDKMREIPMIVSLREEILLYLKAVEAMCGGERSLNEPLLVTYQGGRLYPAYVDRTVKRELGDVKGIRGRRSPHVLRHSLATGLLNDDVDLNSIKELLGHSSLAATQVYTHSNIARLKTIYKQAHPRAKKGGKNGD